PAVALPQPGRDGQRPRCMDLRAVGAVQDQPPVAELVAEPLQHQGAVVRHVASRITLAGQVADQVRCSQFVQAVLAEPGGRILLADGTEIAAPSSAGRPGASPCQNGSLPGWPGAGETSTWSAVMSSIRHELAPSTKTSPTRDS